MARSIQDQLDALDAALANLEAMDAVDTHSEGGNSFRAQRIVDLYAERRRLTDQLNLSNGSARLLKPVRETF